MAIMEITVLPKTEDISVSTCVAHIVQYLKDSGIEHTLTSMSTIIEGDTDYLFNIAYKMHSILFEHGMKRVYTIIKIDDRRDKPLTQQGKISAVMNRIH